VAKKGIGNGAALKRADEFRLRHLMPNWRKPYGCAGLSSRALRYLLHPSLIPGSPETRPCSAIGLWADPKYMGDVPRQLTALSHRGNRGSNPLGEAILRQTKPSIPPQAAARWRAKPIQVCATMFRRREFSRPRKAICPDSEQRWRDEGFPSDR
jgi:hypothetical protein